MTLKIELNYLVRIGVFTPQQKSEWASPSFITPKKDGRVCWISDLRQLTSEARILFVEAIVAVPDRFNGYV